MRLDGVAKRYGFSLPWVVRGVSLEIQPGMLVRFEGKNGSGVSPLAARAGAVAGAKLRSLGESTRR